MTGTNVPPGTNPDPDYDQLTAIFDQFAPPLYKYVLQICHDPVVGDNIVGDVFAQLVEQWVAGKGRPPDIQSYLYQTAYDSALQNLRDQGDHIDAALQRTTFSTSQIGERAKREALLSALKKELTREQHHLMVLLFLQEFSIDEAARILGIPVENALAQLRDIQQLIDKHPELKIDLYLVLKRRRKPK